MPNVAVYGTLKRDEVNHHFLDSSMYSGRFIIGGWDMFSIPGGGFPYIVKGDGNIVVEVYTVDDNTMRNLDGLEGYPRFYDREEIHTPAGPAWIYFWNNKGSESQAGIREENGVREFSWKFRG